MFDQEYASLAAWGKFSDEDFQLLPALWDMAQLDHDAFAIKQAQDVVQQMIESLPEGDDFGFLEQHAALVRVIHDQYDFSVDDLAAQPHYMDIVTVIERRKGLPIALAVLYQALAQAKGWQVTGVNFPGHFLVQMGQGQSRILIDPAQGDILQASDLRRLLKDTLGVHAELQHNHYQDIDLRAWVIRLYNNRKTALLEDNHIADALDVVKALLLIAPFEPRLYYDAAMLATRLDYIQEAISYWDKYIVLADDKAEIEQAKYMVSQLRGMLT
jgi:regulator of sirC expression with transglutaminase-like and TPR domain